MEIRRCADRDVAPLMQFIDLHWRKGHVLATNRELMDWQHKNPDGSYNYLLAWQGAELLGVLGYIPSTRYDAALKDHNLLWLALWKVREDCKIPMLGVRLLKALEAAEPNVVGLGVSGINLAHPPMYKALGYEVADLVQYYMINPERPQTLLKFPAGSALPIPKPGKATCKEMTEKDLLALPMHVLDIMPRKTPVHFIHRFLRHPFYRYRVFALLLEGKVQALIATRVAEHEGKKVLRMVDFMGHTGILAECGAVFAALMQQEQVEYMDFWQYGLPSDVMAAAGFAAIDPQGDTIVSNFFEPFMAKNSRIVCAVKSDKKIPIIVCRADGDQDRPNLL